MDRVTLTKYGLVGLFGFLLLYLLGPMILATAWTLATILVLGIGIMALVFLLPAISEALAQISWVLFEHAIKADPVARLQRDVVAHQQSIDALEARIGQGSAQILDLQALLRADRKDMDAAEALAWEENIGLLKIAEADLVQVRDDEVRKHREFERVVRRAKAEYRLGKAFSGALNALSFKNSTGPKSQGAQIALDSVRRELNSSTSRLQLALSRPKEAREISVSSKATHAALSA